MPDIFGPVPGRNREKACALCGTLAPEIFRQLVVAKHNAAYYRCPSCDLIQMDEPVWFAEFPWTRIAPLDTGAVSRSIKCADLVAAILGVLEMDPDAPGYDMGGGNGLFVRLMRDRGYNFLWHDLYAQNVHATGFLANPDAAYNCVACFEVFEHLPNVNEVLSDLFTKDHQLIVVSTVLHRGDNRPDWYYYHPDIGGHVSFYSRRTMAYLGERFGYNVASSPDFTVFVKGSVSAAQRRVLTRMLTDPAFVPVVAKRLPVVPSLVSSDFDRLAPTILPHLGARAIKRREHQAVSSTSLRIAALLARLPNRRPFSWLLR